MTRNDDALPAAPILMGPGARDLVAAAVEASGATLTHLERRQVLYSPGRSLAVRYAAHVRGVDGRGHVDTIVAAVDVDGPIEGTLVLEAGDLRVGLFRWPHDPRLPGLVDATDRDRATERGWLDGCGPQPAMGVVTYRPGRRSVIHAVGSEAERYLKVVPPSEAPALVERHRRLGAVLPVPEVLAADDGRGVVALRALPGRTLRAALAEDGEDGSAPPRPDVILDLLDRIPTPDAAVRPRRSVTRSARRHARTLAGVLPSARRRLERFVDRVGDDADLPLVAVHGDLHDGQMLVDDRGVSGFLDVDGAGVGTRADDLANLLGHLSTVALDRERAGHRRYLGLLLPAFEEVVEPGELHRRVAAVVLGLATGPFRVQERGWRDRTRQRIALAERWLAGDVRSLSAAS